MGLRADEDDPLLPEDERLRNGLHDGGVGLRISAQRAGDDDPTTSVAWVDRTGAVIEGTNGDGFLQRLRSEGRELPLPGFSPLAERF